MADPTTWRTEFGPDYEVPEFVQFLVGQGLFEDMSWHHDDSPSFGTIGFFAEEALAKQKRRSRKAWDPRGGGEEPDVYYQLWVGHPDVNLREEEFSRFGLSESWPESSDFNGWWDSDDLDYILKKMFSAMQANIMDDIIISPRPWMKILIDPVFPSPYRPEKVLKELLDRYHRGAT